MKQEVSLNKQEVNQAILEYAEKHGVRLDGMDATVEVMATRGDRELFATIALEPKNIKDGSKQEKVVEEVESNQEDIDEGVPVEVEPEDDIDPETRAFG
jgi:hypothetical protein